MNRQSTNFLDIKECLERIDQVVSFSSSVLGSSTASHLKLIHQTRPDLRMFVGLAEPQTNSTQLEYLNGYLRIALADHLTPDQDTVPNRLVRLAGGLSHLSIPDFAKGLIRVTALFGADHAIQMLTGWVANKPIRYWQHIVLDGLSVEQTLEVNPALRAMNLPASSDQLSRHIPHLLRGFLHGEAVFMNRAKLLVEHEFSITAKDGSLDEAKHTCLGIPDFAIEEFCQCLALASNQYVSWLAIWYELDVWDVFGGHGSGMSHRDSSNNGPSVLSPDQLTHACNLFALSRPSGPSGKRLNIAIARWLNSKRQRATLVDQWIDLRIGLEALYLTDASGEARFRVSTHGAWYLGKDFSSRNHYQRTLRDAYDLASRAVHLGEVNPTEANRKLLSEAQDLCRAAILKRLRDNEEPKWNELILGGE